jgi:hypothetical protein
MFFDWIQIALAVFFFSRRAVTRAALLFPWKGRPGCARNANAAESVD